jgi:hypothetical protein
MKIIKHNTGKDAGRISVLHTIASMDPGETWAVEDGLVVLDYVRNACSRYGRLSGRTYTVSSPRANAGMIEITRTK